MRGQAMSSWAEIHRILGESEFAAERQFEKLSHMQKVALANVARVQFKAHLRDYSALEREKIGNAVRLMKMVSKTFQQPVRTKDFRDVDWSVSYEN
ncbi:hypothetical protein IO46_09855 [Gallibacterium anatis]|nr:hypothetical protein JP30_08660 [Gallibacterium anatis IPDH697-78]KGQ50093.1 hypothetical protein IO46_09855 [Gallibacterium anatis]